MPFHEPVNLLNVAITLLINGGALTAAWRYFLKPRLELSYERQKAEIASNVAADTNLTKLIDVLQASNTSRNAEAAAHSEDMKAILSRLDKSNENVERLAENVEKLLVEMPKDTDRRVESVVLAVKENGNELKKHINEALDDALKPLLTEIATIRQRLDQIPLDVRQAVQNLLDAVESLQKQTKQEASEKPKDEPQDPPPEKPEDSA